MSHDERLNRVERDLTEVQREQTRQGVELGAVKQGVDRLSSGMDTLLAREARAPRPLTFQTVALTCTALAAIAGVGWWLIGTSPAVQDLVRRVDRLDDPVVGRVPALERRVETLTGWGPVAVTKGR